MPQQYFTQILSTYIQ